QVEAQYSAAGFDAHGIFLREAVVIRIFGHAANAVAAHFAFQAVGVEHAHADVGLLRRHDEDQAVAADAGVAIGNQRSNARGIRHFLVKAIDVDVVVADAVHLGELHQAGL